MSSPSLKQTPVLDYISRLYYSTDHHTWVSQINKENFKQESTMPDGLDTVMFRARTTLAVDIRHIRQTCTNVNIRKQWETILYNMQGVDIKKDLSSMLTYYCYRSPRVAFIGLDDRDFILSQEVWWDFPEPGMYTSYMHSVEDERFPPVKGIVRATCHIMILVCRPSVAEDGSPATEMMLCTNIDINGLVPKWIVNLGARTAPAQWFADCQRACDRFKNGHFDVKPEDITDWRNGEIV